MIDATQGRRTKAVIVLESGQVVLSAVQPDTIARRFATRRAVRAGRERERSMNRKGILVVVSGFSGVGKGTLMKLLTEQLRTVCAFHFRHHDAARVRERKTEGNIFIRTREAFEELIANDQLARVRRILRKLLRDAAGICGEPDGAEAAMSFWRSSCRERLKIKKKLSKGTAALYGPAGCKDTA